MKSHPKSKLSRGVVLCCLALAVILLAVMPARTASARVQAASATLVNAASYDPARIVAQGSIAALFASGMTTDQPQAASTLPLPTTLANLSVKIDGLQAPLFYASADQINLQVPSGVDLGSANVEVFRGGVASPVATGTATIVEAAPGIFTVNATGRDQASVLNSDYSYNGTFDRLPGSRPEVTGSFVSIYATGCGRTNPIVGDGQPSPFGPLALADGVTTVVIGGVQAQVLFSGLAPGYVGLWQINVFIPSSLATNFATPFSMQLKNQTSNPGATTTIAVANKNEFGTASGKVVSALSGAGIGGANVTLQPSGGGAPRQAVTNGAGDYSVFVISPGGYNLQASAAGFIPASQPTSIAGGATAQLAPIALTPPLASDQARVVVTWTNGYDLDAHLTGPVGGSQRYHVWWNGETNLPPPTTAQLDRDDANGTGPETLTFTFAAGSYKFSVQDYRNRDTSGSMSFASASAVVRVFIGNQQVAFITPPAGGGTLWKVFEIQGQQLSIVNQLSDEPDPSNIKVSY
jgi:uncharacterized protein (TIGR03437 family)